MKLLLLQLVPYIFVSRPSRSGVGCTSVLLLLLPISICFQHNIYPELHLLYQ